MAEGAVEFSDVKLGIVGNDEIGTGEKWEQFLCNRRELRRVLDILVRDAMDLDEIFPEPAMSARRTNEPVAGFDQLAIHKNRDPCGADARVRVVGCFKIQAGDLHFFNGSPRIWVVLTGGQRNSELVLMAVMLRPMNLSVFRRS